MFSTIHGLRIGSRCFAESHSPFRGFHGEKSAKSARAAKLFAPMALINAKSLLKWANTVSHLLITHDLDLLAVTETWPSAEHGDDDLRNICPDGYGAVHLVRSRKGGGGVALINRDYFRVESFPTTFTASPFEWSQVACIHLNSICILLVIVYRPPSQSTKCSDGEFLKEFEDFIQPLLTSSGNLLIVGDFNIHVDNPTNSMAGKFLSHLDSLGLAQLVRDPTHLDGHTFDLIISRVDEIMVTRFSVSDLIIDNFAVNFFVKAHRQVRPPKKILYLLMSR